MKSYFDQLIEGNPFKFNSDKKNLLLLEVLNKLTLKHISDCKEYAKILDSHNIKPPFKSIQDIFGIPVNLFKSTKLISVNDNDIYKVLTSSGTTENSKSHIYLDRQNARDQTLVLNKILKSFLGSKRQPVLYLSKKTNAKDNIISASIAGIRSMEIYAKPSVYLFDSNDDIQLDVLESFLNKYGTQKFFIYGLTSNVWFKFYKVLQGSNIKYDLVNAHLVHTGGWKKLEKKRVTNEVFKQELNKWFNLEKVTNFYGMAEQVGSIFLECEYGLLHPPSTSDILIRDPHTWNEASLGQKGIVQLFSVLPSSYPGHSIISEDYGRMVTIDNCKCGRNGKAFEILGRIPKAEQRGCSNVG